MSQSDATSRWLAFEILERVQRSGAWASVLLDRRESELSDPREIGLLHEIVLGVLRRQRALDHAIDSVSSRPVGEMDPDVRVAVRIGAYSLLYLDRIPDFAAVDEAVSLVRGAHSRARAGFVNAVLRALACRGREALPGRPAERDVDTLALFHSVPDWWAAKLVERHGVKSAEAMLAANNAPAETVLRVDARRTTTERLAARLLAEGIETEPGRYARGALRIVAGRLARTRAIEEGMAWVQDEAAQLVGEMFDGPLGPRVADLCAAPGGKTLQLAQQLSPSGIVVAIDRHAGRLRRMASQVRRFGAEKVFLVQADASERTVPLAPAFRQVLVDAPCSGTGTLRRHPEIRWRLRPEDPKLLAARQRSLLASAARIVVPGGSVVYSVCSMEPEEGEDLVLEFLDARPEFELCDPRPQLSTRARGLVRDPGFLRTFPKAEGLDGFFAARLRKKGTSS